jgi:CRP-like cAMP-binding protein
MLDGSSQLVHEAHGPTPTPTPAATDRAPVAAWGGVAPAPPMRRTAPGVRNGLLAALPADDLARLRPRLERVPLKRKQILQERNLPPSHAYFIEQGTASLVSRSGDGGTIEVGTLGSIDFVGISLVLGTGRSPHRCIVQVPGEALRIDAEGLAQALETVPGLRGLLLGYVQATMVQSAQLAVCNARHSLGERLARWLLVAHERLEGDEIPLTHQSLSRALGVRRASVTSALGQLEDLGLVRGGRGRLTIRDAAGLEEASCDCHRAIRTEHQRLRPAHTACAGGC